MIVKKLYKQNQNIILTNIKTKNLKKKQKLSICKLKNLTWPWTVRKQLEWLKKTAKKTDVHNLMFINNRLAGYTLLRKRIAYKKNKSFIYYYFDSFVLHNDFRNKGLGKVFILFNNQILKKLKKHSFLICPKKTSKFYLKYNWKILPKNRYKIMDHKSFWFRNYKDKIGMTYNLNKKINDKILYYFN